MEALGKVGGRGGGDVPGVGDEGEDLVGLALPIGEGIGEVLDIWIGRVGVFIG